MEREQNVSHKIHNQDRNQRQYQQNMNCNERPRSGSQTQQASEIQHEVYTEQESPMLDNLLSHIGTCQIKTDDEKQKLLSSIEKQQQGISEFRELQEARNKNFIEVKNQNIELVQELQSTYNSLEELESSMIATRIECTELQEQCAPIAMSLMTCVKHKDGLCDFKNDLEHRVTELQDTLNHLQGRSFEIKQYWSQQVDQEKKGREEIKVESQKAITLVRKITEETRTKRIALQQKNDTLEERIKEKQAEQETFRCKMKQEHQKAMDIMLREKKKNEELSELAENHKQNMIMLETRLQEATENTTFWKNKFSDLQQKIADTDEMKKIVIVELENLTAMVHNLETKEQEFEKVLQENNNTEIKLCTELEQSREDYTKMKDDFNELQGSYSKKQEAIESLKKLILENKMLQEKHILKYKSKIGKLKQDIKEKKDELLSIESGLEEDKEETTKLANKLQHNYNDILSLKQEFESTNEEIADCTKNFASLEIQAKKWTESKEEADKKLTETEEKLHELRESLTSQNQKDEEFRSQATREKRELEQELMNAQRELQNSVANSEWIIQQTVTCVEQCKENYAQHVKEKEAVLATLKNDQQSLATQLQDALSEKEHMEIELREKVKGLEDRVEELELQLENKKKLVASSEINISPPKDEDSDTQNPTSILKCLTADKQLNKHVQFIGLNSDSESSLVDAQTLAAATAHRKSLNEPSSLQRKISVEQQINKKFFKTRSVSDHKKNS